jgi:hypothetical protein
MTFKPYARGTLAQRTPAGMETQAHWARKRLPGVDVGLPSGHGWEGAEDWAQ